MNEPTKFYDFHYKLDDKALKQRWNFCNYFVTLCQLLLVRGRYQIPRWVLSLHYSSFASSLLIFYLI